MTADVTLEELGTRLGLAFRGDPATAVRGLATLERAGPKDLSFLANPRYRRFLAATRAGIVVLSEADADQCPAAVLISSDPYADFARAAAGFDTSRRFEPGVHPSVQIDTSARIGADCRVAAGVVVEAGARIGDGVHVGAGCVVERDVTVGDGCFLGARVTLCRGVRLGRRVQIHPGAVIGADGFGIAMSEGRWLKVPQLGSVVIGDDCEIGANTTIDRGTLDDTVLEEDVRLDNQIQIGHNVVIGAHTAMAGCAAVAGSARIGRYCLIGGGAGILGHLEIADHVTITAMSLVTHPIREAGEYSSGTPLQSNREWRRNAVRLRQLDALARKIKKLEQE